MSGLTTDPDDPEVTYGLDEEPQPHPQAGKYLILPEEERARGFVRPVRQAYIHQTCKSITTMSLPLAETYARNPSYYNGTLCVKCRMHRPVSEFTWVDRHGIDTGLVVGS